MNIPPRWLHCPRKGNLVANIFLPFKTPLDSKYDNDVSDEFRYVEKINKINNNVTVFITSKSG